jgi:hypothetical protein
MDTDFEDECKTIVERRKDAAARLQAIDQATPAAPDSPRKMQTFLAIVSTACQVCNSTGDDDAMLLCDGCDHGYHTYCHQPAIEEVPAGDWFCPRCAAEGKAGGEAGTPGSEGRRKPRRQKSAWARGVEHKKKSTAKKEVKRKVLGSDEEEEGGEKEADQTDPTEAKEPEEEQEDEPMEEPMSSPRTSRRGAAAPSAAAAGPSGQAADLAPSVPTGVRVDASRVAQWHADLVRTTDGFPVEKLERIYTAMAKVSLSAASVTLTLCVRQVIRQYRLLTDRTALPTDLQAELQVVRSQEREVEREAGHSARRN